MISEGSMHKTIRVKQKMGEREDEVCMCVRQWEESERKCACMYCHNNPVAKCPSSNDDLDEYNVEEMKAINIGTLVYDIKI